MIGNRRFAGVAMALLLLLAMILMMVMAGCGGDKQEESQVQAELVPETEAEIALEPEEYGADSEPLHPAEMAATEESLVQLPPPAKNHTSEKNEPARIPEGTREVEVVKAPRPAPVSGIDGATVEQNGGDYSIMVGSFLQEKHATVRVDKLRKIGFRPVQETAEIDGQQYHRVHLRGINSYDEAEALGYFLKGKLGLDYLVLKR